MPRNGRMITKTVQPAFAQPLMSCRTEVEDIEMPRLPHEGESLETKFGPRRYRICRRTPAGSSSGSLSSPEIAAGQHVDERDDREDEKDAPGELLAAAQV